MSYAVFAHRKIKHLYHPAFFDSRKIDYYSAEIIKRSTVAVYVANATHKGKKSRGLLRCAFIGKKT